MSDKVDCNDSCSKWTEAYICKIGFPERFLKDQESRKNGSIPFPWNVDKALQYQVQKPRSAGYFMFW